MSVVITISFALLLLAIVLSLFRLRRGPSVLDRILAFDLIATCVVGMIVLLSVMWSTSVYVEVILIVSLLGFFTTVAFVYYLHRSKPVRPKERDGSVPRTGQDQL
jgi:multisubunit Na+/H+ antiporter MnhF subunit